MGIASVITSFSTWSNTATVKHKGTQIDLIIDRADHCINLCEIKFYNNHYQMTKLDVERLNHKREIFQQVTQTQKTLFITLITSYGAIENDFYHQAVDGQIKLDDLFV